jgi:hypothetical protein
MKPIAGLLMTLLASAVAGCHVHRARYFYEAGTSHVSGGTREGASVAVSGDSRLLAGVIVAIMVADGIRYYLRRPDGSLTPIESPPEADASRRVSEQDCSGPITLDGGNLRCR